jgi:hypothetical protein
VAGEVGPMPPGKHIGSELCSRIGDVSIHQSVKNTSNVQIDNVSNQPAVCWPYPSSYPSCKQPLRF